MIKVFNSKGEQVDISSFKFSGGEVNVKILNPSEIEGYAYINAQVKSSDDLMELLLITDAIRQENPRTKIELVMPYLPYARQDRVMVPGEALSIKVFANIINAQKYDSVYVWDAHSDVGVALIDRCYSMKQEYLVQMANFDLNPKNTILVSPDAGAEKKIYKFAKALGFKDILFASKVRDVSTGKIVQTKLQDSWITDQDFLIADDICDGGGTFIALAEKLRPLTSGKIKLLVTHGIFSKGIEVFDGIIDEIYVLNNINNVVSTEKTKVIG